MVALDIIIILRGSNQEDYNFLTKRLRKSRIKKKSRIKRNHSLCIFKTDLLFKINPKLQILDCFKKHV